jgi:hypothetical protein
MKTLFTTSAAIAGALGEGKTVEAVVVYRSATGCGLIEAYDFVKAIKADEREQAIFLHRAATCDYDARQFVVDLLGLLAKH